MANTHLRFKDDIDNYEPSDSEDEYEEKEKTLLLKARAKPHNDSDSEEEVYSLDADSSSSDSSENENADSDIEKAHDDLPDVRAWGKSKRDFYSTDYVDQDFGGFQGKDANDAEFEENEARDIQKRLAEQLDDEDFSLDIFLKKEEQDLTKNLEIIKNDMSSLSKRELIQHLRYESPEMVILIEDCTVKMERIKKLHPILLKNNQGQIVDCEAVEFVKSLFHMSLNYCSNIYMYLLLKASKVNVQKHPVVKRLYQYRKLIEQLEPLYNEIIGPQIDVFLTQGVDDTEEIKKETVKKFKKLKLLQNMDKSSKKSKKAKSTDDIEEPPVKKSKAYSGKSVETTEGSNEIDCDTLEDEVENEREEFGNDEIQETKEDTRDSKRAITYQMQKNKGLTPHRKKEQRNPRVKHRNKFRKANIRRKGAVREVRKELSRYGGEISGIKATVSKSTKLK